MSYVIILDIRLKVSLRERGEWQEISTTWDRVRAEVGRSPEGGGAEDIQEMEKAASKGGDHRRRNGG